MDISGVLSLKDFIAELAITISTGGNLVMNFPPDKNGRVLPIFEERLRDIGKFIGAHEEAIYTTKPWIFQNDTDSTIWYTSRLRNASGFDPYRYYNPQQENNTIIYAFVLEWPIDNIVSMPLIIPTRKTTITLLGTNISLPVVLDFDGGMETSIAGISAPLFPSLDVFVLKIEYAADQNVNPLED
uniref:alpha-L-fucosidase n=1 Tax=Acrobeloides nanus TaxID=290746 RepID=A0A914DU16_9BILA